MKFDMIAFDADDTLWHTEIYYREVEQQFLDILSTYGIPDRESALRHFHRIEIANLPDFGYGIKGFTISLMEAAIEITNGQVRGGDLRAIIELGRGMVRHEIIFLPGVEACISQLSRSHPLALVTKGDLMDQERKIAVSGLGQHFRNIEILSDKTPETYSALFSRLDVEPARLLMVGNSMRSDILPVLALGGWAVLIRYSSTWAHEMVGEVSPENMHRFFEIDHLGDLPDLVDHLENKK